MQDVRGGWERFSLQEKKDMHGQKNPSCLGVVLRGPETGPVNLQENIMDALGVAEGGQQARFPDSHGGI